MSEKMPQNVMSLNAVTSAELKTTEQNIQIQ